MIKITDNMSREQIALALDVSLLYGFMSESAVFPVASADGNLTVPDSYDKLCSLAQNSLYTEKNSSSPLPFVQDSLFSLDFRTVKGLENLFCDGMFLKDTDSDFMPDRLDVKFILPSNADKSVVCAACNFAFRFGMETVAYTSHLLAEEDYCGNAIVFTDKGSPEAVLEHTDGIFRLYINGSGSELERFSVLVCEKFPLTGTFDRWSDILLEMTRDFAMETADGQLAHLAAQDETATLFCTPDLEQWQKDFFPMAKFCDRKADKPVYTKSYDIPWEADILRQILEQNVYPIINGKDKVTVKGAVSENAAVRSMLTEEICGKIAAKGAVVQKAELVNAYKQGFSWLSEFVVPQLKTIGTAFDKIEICFKPFLPYGSTDWLDENGATPNRTRGLEDNPDKWFDLPIRYLQELYPIDDVISQQLGTDRSNICFTIYDGNDDITYLCKAYCGERVAFSACYKSRCSEKPYMDEYPQLGKVHPSTAYIEVAVNDRVIFETTFKTDLENVWDIYQSDVLPDCRRYIENKTKGNISADLQPFFSCLSLDVSLSEEECSAGCREDIISPLSALHEDMYFTGGDYFKYYGQSHGNMTIDAPGLILPQIHLCDGKPHFTVTLYEQAKDFSCIEKGSKTLAAQLSKEDISLWVSRLSMENDQLTITVSSQGVAENVLKSYANLWNKKALQKSRTLQNCGKIIFAAPSGSLFEACCNPDPVPAKDKDISQIKLYEKEIIGYDEYLEIINQLKQVKGVEIFPVAKSYKGRTIYAIWLKKQHRGYLSLTKYLSNRVSQFINARHHANEVSSTNAAFMLVKQLLTDEKYTDLADRLSLVIVPVENADGTAIHYTLQQQHPLWQLHVARFNALGKEFAYEYFSADPLSSEALSTGRIYSRFVPDIMVDNHGVPSHEWDQQFSGYTSPAYKGFWLPRSLLYGYFWYIKDPQYAANIEVNKKMEAEIARIIAQNEQMTALNREWTAVFEKYAHRWMPLLFPAEYYGDMINYWIGYNMNHSHMYAAIRYPWLTSIAYTSEVADETAQGDYLNLCAQAHLAHDIATIDMLLRGENRYEKEISVCNGTITAKNKRIRPIKIK